MVIAAEFTRLDLWPIWAAAGVLVLWLGFEALHGLRVRRVARLAFGPVERPRLWARVVPAVKPLAGAALAWGLATLYLLPPKVHRAEGLRDEEYQHMMLVLDVSPSMRLKDAGPDQIQSRQERARDVLQSMFSRVTLGRYKISVVATYTDALPVVIDTVDADVVQNILSELPMHFAFRSGQTRLFKGLEKAFEIAKDWDPDSTLLVMVSDGDTVPATGMPSPPKSISGVLVVGIGDPVTGRFVDGRQSRQDASTLRQIAIRLGGEYHDANTAQIPSAMIRGVTQSSQRSAIDKLSRREYALLAVGVGAAVLGLLPWLLHAFGSGWRPGVPRPARNAAIAAAPRPRDRESRPSAVVSEPASTR